MAGPLTNDEVQEKIKLVAPMILEKNNLKSLLSKEFSMEHPESNLMATVFQTTKRDDVINT